MHITHHVFRGGFLSGLQQSGEKPAGTRSVAWRSARSIHCNLATALLCLVIFAAGCGTSSPTKAGAILLIDSNGSVGAQLTSLPIGSTARATMMPIHDSLGSGVDWSVTCGGSPITGSVTGTSCGSFSPPHTSDSGTSTYTAPALIPLGGNVTLTAAVTSDPSARSSIAVPIVPLQISVVFLNPPTTVQAGASVNFAVNALNDTSGAGVTLSLTCQSSAANGCGTLSNLAANSTTGTYNAPSAVPAGGTVTITATSVTVPAQSANITLTVEPQASGPAISVSVTPSTLYVATVGQGHTVRLSALVTGDTSGAGVTWEVTCGSADCGTTPQPSQSGQQTTYRGPATVPAGGSVTITARSVADTTKTAYATASIVTASPILIHFTLPPPANLSENSVATLAATANSGTQGIAWSATCGSVVSGACGSFNPPMTNSGDATAYSAPSAIPPGAVVTLTAASAGTTPANSAVADTTITAPSPTIAFTVPPPPMLTTLGQVPVSATVSNDLTPGGVTWTLNCGATVPGGCGSLSPYQTANGFTTTYTAPPVPPTGGVTINATSTAFPSVTVPSSPITINASTAVEISFVPFAPSSLAGYATLNLNAAVSNDASNAGVDWSVCPSGCGLFTLAAAVPAIAATPRSPFVPAVPAVIATIANGWPNGLPISYTAPQALTATSPVTITATAHASPLSAISATVAIGNSNAGPALHGIVRAGNLPIAGAAVALYAAGMAGYASASTQLYAPGGASYAVTDSDGSFALEGGYFCPSANSQVYLLASGGRIGQGKANANAVLMTALGPCSNLSSTPVVINEVTTIGSVWPLAPFAANNPLNGQSSSVNIGSSGTNTTGLADAFASVNNLVDVTSGTARYSVPAANAAVPYVEINTLADALNSCTNTAGGVYLDGTPCGTLFMVTAPLGSGGPYNGTVPTDTLQAAFNIAQHPDGGLGYGFTPSYLYGMVTQTAPFQPILANAPTDWSIALSFMGGGPLIHASAVNYFALDGSNDLWMTDTAGNSVIEWNSLGVSLASSLGLPAGGILSPGPIALDSIGNVWISAANGLTELYPRGAPVEGSPYRNGGGGIGLAIDGLNNVWVVNPLSVSEFDNAGLELSPTGGYINAGFTPTGPIAIDSGNRVLSGDQPGPNSAFALAYLSDLNGAVVVNTEVGGDFDVSQTQIAVDGTGTAWIPAGPGTGSLCKLPAYGGLGTQQLSTCYSAGPGSLNSLYGPRGIAIDGGGAVWFGNAGGAGVSPNITEMLPSQGPATYAAFSAPSLEAGPLMLAIDGSGNVWVLVANNTVTEYVGIARPTLMPLATAVKTGRVGRMP